MRISRSVLESPLELLPQASLLPGHQMPALSCPREALDDKLPAPCLPPWPLASLPPVALASLPSLPPRTGMLLHHGSSMSHWQGCPSPSPHPQCHVRALHYTQRTQCSVQCILYSLQGAVCGVCGVCFIVVAV